MNRNDPLDHAPIVGIDAGASLVKLAIEHPSGELRLEKLPSHDVTAVANHVANCRPGDVCLTGGGAASIEPLLAAPTTVYDEFASWAAGARRLLRTGDHALLDRLLLVSLGTGTSVQLVDGSSSQRVGGTALDGMALAGWPMRTIVDGVEVHSRNAGGTLRGNAVDAPGSAGRALEFS